VAPVATIPADSTVEVQSTRRDKSNVNAVLVVDRKADDTGAENVSLAVPKGPEWAEVPIKTIPPIKTSVSLVADSKRRSEEGMKEMVSTSPSHSHSERSQTGQKQEVTLKQDSGSQHADGSVDEVRKVPSLEQSTVAETSAMVERKLTCVAPRPVQEGLPKLAHVRLRSIDAKAPDAAQDEFGREPTKTGESSSPVNLAGAVHATPFGLGSYLDVPVGQDISSSGTWVPFVDSRVGDSNCVPDTIEAGCRFQTCILL
jgi:hypothetical protein